LPRELTGRAEVIARIADIERTRFCELLSVELVPLPWSSLSAYGTISQSTLTSTKAITSATFSARFLLFRARILGLARQRVQGRPINRNHGFSASFQSLQPNCSCHPTCDLAARPAHAITK